MAIKVGRVPYVSCEPFYFDMERRGIELHDRVPSALALGERERAQGLEREKDFWGPTGVTVDDDNRIFICESARNRIQVYRKQAPVFAGPRL